MHLEALFTNTSACIVVYTVDILLQDIEGQVFKVLRLYTASATRPSQPFNHERNHDLITVVELMKVAPIRVRLKPAPTALLLAQLVLHDCVVL